MKLGVEGHARYRELISARLDESLAEAAETELERHLEGCSRCRSAERDYRAQRARLAALPAVPAPRDLWARTSAALDLELARSPREARRAAREDGLGDVGRSSRLLAIWSASSLALALVVIATQLNTVVTVPPNAERQTAVPTPFDVPREPVVFADFSADGVTVYQTEVGQVCPTPTIECSAADVGTRQVLRVTGSGGRSGVAVHSGQGRLALLAMNDTGQETISVVTLPADATGSGSSAATGSSSPGQGAGAGRTNRLPGATNPTHASPASPAASQPTGVAQKSPTHHDASPPASDSAARPPQPTAPTPKGTSAGTHAVGSRSMATTSIAILDGVRTAGAPAAWSRDGDMLAFSAMPADRSTGPDVYVWRLDEAKATRLTSDHRSYFASWAGSRIVVSRVIPPPKGKGPGTGTFELDPANGAMRQVPVSRMWLPAVDPNGRWAISWMGTLVVAGSNATPTSGGLYLVDWRSVDPFVDHKAIVAPGVTVGPDADGRRHPLARPAPSGTPRQQAKPGRAGGRATLPSPAVLAPVAAPGALGIMAPEAVERGRDESADAVLDWQVRWADKGGIFGYWIADGPGANWGRLAVLRLLPGSAGIDYGTGLLDPTLARRSFSLGSDRVAWVAPSDDRPAGELRLRTWDVHGYGGLRIRDLNVGGGVPAF